LNGTFFTAVSPKEEEHGVVVILLIIVLVLVLLVAFRLFWVLAIKRAPM